MTTTTKLSPVEVCDRLQELLSLATEYAAAELKMRRLAEELLSHEDDWTEDLPHFTAAVHYEIKSALAAVAGESDLDGLEVASEIQDAIEILNFAISRDDRREEGDA